MRIREVAVGNRFAPNAIILKFSRYELLRYNDPVTKSKESKDLSSSNFLSQFVDLTSYYIVLNRPVQQLYPQSVVRSMKGASEPLFTKATYYRGLQATYLCMGRLASLIQASLEILRMQEKSENRRIEIYSPILMIRLDFWRC